MRSAQVLITGAGGFVGRALTVGFADLGWQVHALDRFFDVGLSHRNVQSVTVDLAKDEWGAIPEVDVVVHAAWVTTDPGALGITPAEYFDVNVIPLAAVLRRADLLRPRAFVFLSSSGVFAHGDAAGGLTDADRPTADTPYAKAKRHGELLTMERRGASSTTFHVARLGYLFGPNEVARPSRRGVSLMARWLRDARGGRRLRVRADDPRRDWTFTPDLARALEQLAAGPPTDGPVHLGSPHVLRDSELAALITAEVPGSEAVTVPGGPPLKPPMVPSDLPALRGLRWTEPDVGLHALLGGEVAA